MAAASSHRVRFSSRGATGRSVEVSVYVGRFGNKSMRLDFEVRRKGETELIATAHFVLASVRRDTFETVPIPAELRTRLAEYTKGVERFNNSNS